MNIKWTQNRQNLINIPKTRHKMDPNRATYTEQNTNFTDLLEQNKINKILSFIYLLIYLVVLLSFITIIIQLKINLLLFLFNSK